MNDKIPSVLTIAGSDSGGGAGIQADLRTFHAFKLYGSSVITSITAQNPHEVKKVNILSPDLVKDQMESVLTAFPVRYAKTGMLGNKEVAGCVAKEAEKYALSLIVDPVMFSTSGARLLEESAICVIKEKLFPLAEWITPNIPEAEYLCEKHIATEKDLAEAAEFLYRKYRCNVLLKSGHFITSEIVTDLVCYQGDLFTLSSPVVKVNGNTAHGTGCTLSAAITANLAWRKSWQEALTEAKTFVFGSLLESRKINDTLSQMYPPEGTYPDRIILQPR